MHKSLSDFMHMKIVRNDNQAQLIFDHFDDPASIHHGKPIRLIGFSTDSNQSDFAIREEGYIYYCDLFNIVNELKH